MTTPRYTVEQLQQAVANSFSFSNVLRELGIKQAGGSQTHITNRIKLLDIDTSHFTGQGWNKGTVSTQRKTALELLVIRDPNQPKLKTSQLRRSLLELSRKEICEECGVDSEYNQKILVLEIDHVSGESWDNRPENLRFLCPNCHSQQDTNKPWKNRVQ
jgi:hypothetical protein